MLKFLKESIKEFDHVVWPTNKETKKYFTIVTSVITVLTIFLFIVWSLFSLWLFGLWDLVRTPKAVESNTTASDTTKNVEFASWADLKLIPTDTTAPAPTK
ncbi:MAG: hypothetical protein ACD_3C00013G0013 [uncultured bacterium (gcode 4)]|uniref:Protein translocase subunit SecE n=1 Tax=uncultured bacterium (gcode 4) TaxID=1234023 RepID=K2GZ76_9BACT|nr:MAG: hypothetical protein ACD_3C00013G0013 [uncultured bacterium (gcode 4)]